MEKMITKTDPVSDMSVISSQWSQQSRDVMRSVLCAWEAAAFKGMEWDNREAEIQVRENKDD